MGVDGVDACDQSRSVSGKCKFVEVAVNFDVSCPYFIDQAVGVVVGEPIAVTYTIAFLTFPKSQILLAEILLHTGTEHILEGPVHVDGTQVVGIQDERRREWRGVVTIMFDEYMGPFLRDGTLVPYVDL